MPEHVAVRELGGGGLEGDAALLQIGVKAHGAEAHAALAHGGVARAADAVGRVLDEVLEHVVEELHRVVDELLVAAPLVVVLEVDGGEAADGRAVLRGRQENLGAEVGAVNGEPLVLEPGGQRAVGRVGEDEIGLARVHAHLKEALPEVAGGDGRDDLARGRVTKIPGVVRIGVAHRGLDLLHEGVGDVDAVVQIEGLEVLVARGLAHLDERNDVRMVDREEGGVGAAAGRTLTVGEAGGVVDLEVRHHAHGLLVGRADADVDAHAAAEHGEAVDLGERLDEAFGAVVHVGEIARDGKPAARAAEGENGRRKGKPVAACVFVDAGGVLRVRAEGLGHELEALLRTLLVRAHVAFAKAHEPELIKERVAALIDLNGHRWGSFQKGFRNFVESWQMSAAEAPGGTPTTSCGLKRERTQELASVK